jgi:hypothetical protein
VQKVLMECGVEILAKRFRGMLHNLVEAMRPGDL